MKHKIITHELHKVWLKCEYEVEAESIKKAKIKVRRGMAKCTRSEPIPDTMVNITHKENFAMEECDGLISDDYDVDLNRDYPVFKFADELDEPDNFDEG